MTQLTEQFYLPEQYHKPCQRLTELVAKHAQRLLEQEYWTPEHLENIQEHTGQSYTYIRDDPTNLFEQTEEYLYSRFKRCIYSRVARTLDAHTDEYNAYQFVTSTVKEQKIRAVGWGRIRNELLNNPNSPYIEWSILENVVKQLNNYYDTHGQFPEDYTELVKTPEPNGTLPYAPDKGDYQIHNLEIEENEIVFTMNAPDALSPSSYHDWSEHEIRSPTHKRFENTLELGDMKAPTLHQSEHGYTLDVPVEISEAEVETKDDRVVSVDLGVKKQATTTVVESNGEDELEQISPPEEITIAGKAPPEPDELQQAREHGFDDIELYLERTHLQNVDETVGFLEDSSVNVVSVHTPHVPIEQPEWLHRSDRLANELDAYLVVHSNRIIHTFIPELEQLELQSEYGYENNPGISERHIRSMILNEDHEFVLDTAHLYMAESNYFSIANQFLSDFGNQIRFIHLCDSTLRKDGLGFGNGAMDMASFSRLIGQHFDGTLVLEVMPGVQKEAEERLLAYWEGSR